MKKLILLFTLASFVLTSCSSNDDDDTPSVDAYVGTWTWHQSFTNDVEYPLDACDKKDSIVVNADGTYSITYYDSNADGTCTNYEAETGTWKNLGNGVYEITSDPGTPNEDIFEINITFNDNTLIFTEVFGSDTYKEIYIRN